MSNEVVSSSLEGKRKPIQILTNTIKIGNKNLLDVPENDENNRKNLSSIESRADSRTDIDDSITKDNNSLGHTTPLIIPKYNNTQTEITQEKQRYMNSSPNTNEYENSIDEGMSPIKIIARKEHSPLPYDEIKKLGKQLSTVCTTADDVDNSPEKTKNLFLQNVLSGLLKTDSGITDEKKEDNDHKPYTRARSVSKSEARRRWDKLSHVVRSIHLLKSTQVKSISHYNIPGEISDYKIRNFNSKKRDHAREDYARDAFDGIRRTNTFCENASIGSEKHIQMMVEMIENDPKKHFLNNDDPFHLLNKKDHNGISPLFYACKNGNLKAVQVLLKYKADPFQPSKVGKKGENQLPIHAAVDWNHQKVVECLLENVQFSYQALKTCLKLAPNKPMKKTIEKHMQERFPNLVSSCGCL